MNEIRTWNYQSAEVRTIQQNGEPWFVLSDVCRVLELSTPARVAERLDEDEVSQTHTIDRLGRTQNSTIINESGLYTVILRSDKPQAKPFRKWVTSEVLPAIRRHGMYATDELLRNPDLAIAAFTELKAEQERRKALETTVAVQVQQIQELTPKACYYDVVLNCPDLLSTSAIAKDYGKSAKWLNRYLHDKGVQFKQSGIWLLYQKYAEKGYTSTKTHNVNGSDGKQHTKVHTYWTQKGRLFIYDLLRADGVLPIAEAV